LDKEFKEKLTKREEQLKAEQALGKWTFTVSKWTVDPILKKRSELLADKKPANSTTNSPAATEPDPIDLTEPSALPLPTLPEPD
jgi:hypothetical protein